MCASRSEISNQSHRARVVGIEQLSIRFGLVTKDADNIDFERIDQCQSLSTRRPSSAHGNARGSVIPSKEPWPSSGTFIPIVT